MVVEIFLMSKLSADGTTALASRSKLRRHLWWPGISDTWFCRCFVAQESKRLNAIMQNLDFSTSPTMYGAFWLQFLWQVWMTKDRPSWLLCFQRFNVSPKQMKLISEPSNQSSELFKATRFGNDMQSKCCWTVSRDSDSPRHFQVHLSFWVKSNTRVQEQPRLQNYCLGKNEDFTREWEIIEMVDVHFIGYKSSIASMAQRSDPKLLRLWRDRIATGRRAWRYCRASCKIDLPFSGRCLQAGKRYLSMHPLLSLDPCAMQASWSARLMIHAQTPWVKMGDLSNLSFL